MLRNPAIALLPLTLFADVTMAEAWDNERPAWTPDGRIVYSSKRNGNWDLFVMDADGSKQEALTDTDASEMFPAVSPDGNAIAYVKEFEGNYDICVIGLTDRVERRITQHPGIDDWPSWYRGGSSIVFDSDRSSTWGFT